MTDADLLEVIRRIFAGDAKAGDELSRRWSMPLDRRMARLRPENRMRVKILMDAVLTASKRKTPQAFFERLREVERMVAGMERITGVDRGLVDAETDGPEPESPDGGARPGC